MINALTSLDGIVHKIQAVVEPKIWTFIKPKYISNITTCLPLRVNSFIAEMVFNHLFNEQIEDDEFIFLENRILRVNISDIDLNIGISYLNDKIVCTQYCKNTFQADVSLSIESVDAIDLIQQKVDPDTLFFQRKLKISGDTELAHHVKNTMDTLDPDLVPKILRDFLAAYRRGLKLNSN